MKPDWWNISDIAMKFILTLCLGLALGYWWAYSIYLTDNSNCEKDSIKLEQEFHQAVEKPRSFHIFNHQFRVWPVGEKRFHYKKVSSNKRRM